MAKWSLEARARASERMRRQWSDPAARQRRLSGMARKEARENMRTAQQKNDFRRKLDYAAVLKLHEQRLKNKAIAERFGVTEGAIYHALRAIKKHQGERLPTSKALQAVRRRIAEREARQARNPPPVATSPKREPARLWNLLGQPSITHATEPPPMPKLKGWQKILCGRLRSE